MTDPQQHIRAYYSPEDLFEKIKSETIMDTHKLKWNLVKIKSLRHL